MYRRRKLLHARAQEKSKSDISIKINRLEALHDAVPPVFSADCIFLDTEKWLWYFAVQTGLMERTEGYDGSYSANERFGIASCDL